MTAQRVRPPRTPSAIHGFEIVGYGIELSVVALDASRPGRC